MYPVQSQKAHPGGSLAATRGEQATGATASARKNADIFYDALIVGAGPAGCMAALSAPPGARVLLVDARALPRNVICGGILSGWSMRQLDPFGPMPETVFREPKVIDWSLHDWDMERTGGLRDNYYFNVDRKRFDSWLLELAAAREKTDIWPLTRFRSAHVVDNGDAITVSIGRGDEHILVATRLLIGADGAGSAVRRFIGGRPGPDYWVTIQEKIRSGGEPVDRFLALLGGDLDYYGWVIPKDDELTIGTGFARGKGSPLERFMDFKAELAKRYGIEGASLEKPRARPVTRLKSRREISAGCGRILLAGEAAGLIAPWSGEGIAYALASGAAAGRSLGAPSLFKAYREEIFRLTPRLVVDITGRKVMKRRFSRLAAATLFPRAFLNR